MSDLDRETARVGYLLGVVIGRAMNRLRYYPHCEVVDVSGLESGFIVCNVPRQNDQQVKFRHNFPVAVGDHVDVIYDPALGYDVLRSSTGADDFNAADTVTMTAFAEIMHMMDWMFTRHIVNGD